MLSNTERILVYMASLGKDTIVTLDDFRTALSLTSAQIHSLLAPLMQKDWVKRIATGQYVLTNLGIQQILSGLKPEQEDKHKIDPAKVRVWTIDNVLKYMIEKGQPVTGRELYEKLFLSSSQDTNARLCKLRKWNLVKKGKLITVKWTNQKVRTYEVTTWGKAYWAGKRVKRKKATENTSEGESHG